MLELHNKIYQLPVFSSSLSYFQNLPSMHIMIRTFVRAATWGLSHASAVVCGQPLPLSCPIPRLITVWPNARPFSPLWPPLIGP